MLTPPCHGLCETWGNLQDWEVPEQPQGGGRAVISSRAAVRCHQLLTQTQVFSGECKHTYSSVHPWAWLALTETAHQSWAWELEFLIRAQLPKSCMYWAAPQFSSIPENGNPQCCCHILPLSALVKSHLLQTCTFCGSHKSRLSCGWQ